MIKKNKKNLPRVTHYDNVDEKGVFHDADIANTRFGGYKYEVIHPITNKPCKIPDKGFRFPESTMLRLIEENEIMFGEDETTLIKPKKRLEDVKDMLRSIIYEDGRTSTKIVENLIGRSVFDNPKSHFILKRLLDFTTQNDDVILDFFSGSATTAHAVMQLNKEDGGNRKFIMVQLPEETDEKSEAYKAGYKNICEIGKERIRRAAHKIREEKWEKIQKDAAKKGIVVDYNDEQDYGFRVYRLDSSNMEDVYYRPQDYKQDQMDLFADNVKQDRTPEDLLTQVMLDWGLQLSLPIERKTISGKEVFSVAENSLYACFDEGIDEAFAKEIAKDKPLRIVFRDKGFKDDTAKENVKQLLKQLSAETEMRVI